MAWETEALVEAGSPPPAGGVTSPCLVSWGGRVNSGCL